VATPSIRSRASPVAAGMFMPISEGQLGDAGFIQLA
jgi:hypothetical protein